MASPEHLLQCQLIERVRFELVPIFPELRGPHFEETGALRILAIPNGDGRPIRAAVRVKMEGGQSGVPDLLLPIPRGGFHSAWIELKSAKGKPSKNQKDWLAFLQQQGHAVLISKDLEEAFLFLAHYMAGALPVTHQEDAAVLIAKGPSHVH